MNNAILKLAVFLVLAGLAMLATPVSSLAQDDAPQILDVNFLTHIGAGTNTTLSKRGEGDDPVVVTVDAPDGSYVTLESLWIGTDIDDYEDTRATRFILDEGNISFDPPGDWPATGGADEWKKIGYFKVTLHTEYEIGDGETLDTITFTIGRDFRRVVIRLQDD